MSDHNDGWPDSDGSNTPHEAFLGWIPFGQKGKGQKQNRKGLLPSPEIIDTRLGQCPQNGKGVTNSSDSDEISDCVESSQNHDEDTSSGSIRNELPKRAFSGHVQQTRSHVQMNGKASTRELCAQCSSLREKYEKACIRLAEAEERLQGAHLQLKQRADEREQMLEQVMDKTAQAEATEAKNEAMHEFHLRTVEGVKEKYDAEFRKLKRDAERDQRRIRDELKVLLEKSHQWNAERESLRQQIKVHTSTEKRLLAELKSLKESLDQEQGLTRSLQNKVQSILTVQQGKKDDDKIALMEMTLSKLRKELRNAIKVKENSLEEKEALFQSYTHWALEQGSRDSEIEKATCAHQEEITHIKASTGSAIRRLESENEISKSMLRKAEEERETIKNECISLREQLAYSTREQSIRAKDAESKVETMAAKLLTFDSSTHIFEKDFAKKQLEVADLKVQVATLTDKTMALKEHIAETEKKLVESKNETQTKCEIVQRLEVNERLLKDEVLLKATKIEHLEENVRSLSNDLLSMHEQVKLQATRLEEASAFQDQDKVHLIKSAEEIRILQKEIADLKEKLAICNLESEQFRSIFEEQAREVSSLSANVADSALKLQTENGRHEELIKRFEDCEADRLKQDRAALEMEIQMEKLNDENSYVRQLLTDATLALERSTAEVTRLRNELAASLERLRSTEEKVKYQEQVNDNYRHGKQEVEQALKAELQSRDEALVDLKAKLALCDPVSNESTSRTTSTDTKPFKRDVQQHDPAILRAETALKEASAVGPTPQNGNGVSKGPEWPPLQSSDAKIGGPPSPTLHDVHDISFSVKPDQARLPDDPKNHATGFMSSYEPATIGLYPRPHHAVVNPTSPGSTPARPSSSFFPRSQAPSSILSPVPSAATPVGVESPPAGARTRISPSLLHQVSPAGIKLEPSRVWQRYLASSQSFLTRSRENLASMQHMPVGDGRSLRPQPVTGATRTPWEYSSLTSDDSLKWKYGAPGAQLEGPAVSHWHAGSVSPRMTSPTPGVYGWMAGSQSMV